MLRPNRIGNSEGGEFCFFAAAEVPLPPGETPGGDGEAPAGASTCRAVAASATLPALVRGVSISSSRIWRGTCIRPLSPAGWGGSTGPSQRKKRKRKTQNTAQNGSKAVAEIEILLKYQ